MQLSRRSDGAEDGRADTGASDGGVVDGSGVGAGMPMSMRGVGTLDGLIVGATDGPAVGVVEGASDGHGPHCPSVKWFFTSLVAIHRALGLLLKQKRTPGKGAPLT